MCLELPLSAKIQAKKNDRMNSPGLSLLPRDTVPIAIGQLIHQHRLCFAHLHSAGATNSEGVDPQCDCREDEELCTDGKIQSPVVQVSLALDNFLFLIGLWSICNRGSACLPAVTGERSHFPTRNLKAHPVRKHRCLCCQVVVQTHIKFYCDINATFCAFLWRYKVGLDLFKANINVSGR